MRLISPSPGEAYDRMTILILKIKNSDRQEFVTEHALLCKYMDENHYKVPAELANELGQINKRLWDLEDQQRKILKDTTWRNDTSLRLEFAENAKIVIELNDARAETVKKINVACGIDSVEKIYGTN